MLHFYDFMNDICRRIWYICGGWMISMQYNKTQNVYNKLFHFAIFI